MTINEFWELIEGLRDSDNKGNALHVELKKLIPNEIVSFQEHFDTLVDSAYTWPLWGAAYVIDGGCSDDGFIDFRYGLISLGQETYENAVADPDTLSSLGNDVEIGDELFGYVAAQVYEEMTGSELPRKEGGRLLDPVGEEWDFDDEVENKQRLPNLMAMYW